MKFLIFGALAMAWSGTFIEWINQPIRDAVLVWKLGAKAEDVDVVRYVATEARVTDGTDMPANELIDGRVEADVPYSAGMSHPFSNTVSTGGSGGQIELTNVDAGIDAWADWDWRDEVQEAYLGDRSWPLSDFERIYRVTADYVEADLDKNSIVLGNPLGRFDEAVQSIRWDETVVNPALRGELQPRLFGRAHYLAPAVIDELTFQIADSADVTLDRVFANGFELSPLDGVDSGWDDTRTTSTVALSNGDRTISFAGNSFLGDAHGLGVIDLQADANPRYFELRLDALTAVASTVAWFGLGDDQVSLSGSPGDLGESYGWRWRSDGPSSISKQDGGGSWTLIVDNLQALQEGDVLGFLIEPLTRRLTFFRNGTSIAQVLVEESANGDVWYPHVLFEFSSSIVDMEVTLATSISDMQFIPDELLSSWVFGRFGDYSGSGQTFALVRDPNRAKITAHAAAVSPLAFEPWSVNEASWTVSGSDRLTIERTAHPGDESAMVAQPRGGGRFAVEFEALNVADAPAVELVGAFPMDPTLAPGDQGRFPATAGGLSWRAGGAIRAKEETVAGGTSWTTGDTLALVTDWPGQVVEAWKNGSLIHSLAFSSIVDVTGSAGGSAFAYAPEELWNFDGTLVNAGETASITLSLAAGTESYEADERLFFDGDDRLVGTSPISLVEPFTVAIVFEPDSLPGIQRFLFDQNWMALSFTSAGILTGTYLNAGLKSVSTATGVISADTRFAVVMSFDDVDEFKMHFRPDGGLDDSVTAVSPSVGSGGGVNLVVGCSRFNNNYYRGTIDAIRVYDQTFTEGEITALIDDLLGASAGPAAAISQTFAPAVLGSAVGDEFRVRVTDLIHDYGATPWGEAATSAEMIRSIAGDGADDEYNFAQAVARPYLLGHLADDGQAGLDVLNQVALSIGGGVTVTREGLVRSVLLVDPSTIDAGRLIDGDLHVQAGGNVSRALDRGERLSTAVGAWRIGSPHTAGEIAGEIEEDAIATILQRQYGIISTPGTEAEPLHATYAAAADAEPLPTLISDGDPVDPTVPRSSQALSDAIAALYSVRRHFYTVPYTGLALLEVGEVISLQLPRWGLDDGKNLMVLQVTAEDLDNTGTVVLWG